MPTYRKGAPVDRKSESINSTLYSGRGHLLIERVSLLIAHYIAEGGTCPDFEDVDEDVAESEGEEACTRHDGDE
jgi:hypothetical protein